MRNDLVSAGADGSKFPVSRVVVEDRRASDLIRRIADDESTDDVLRLETDALRSSPDRIDVAPRCRIAGDPPKSLGEHLRDLRRTHRADKRREQLQLRTKPLVI